MNLKLALSNLDNAFCDFSIEMYKAKKAMENLGKIGAPLFRQLTKEHELKRKQFLSVARMMKLNA